MVEAEDKVDALITGEGVVEGTIISATGDRAEMHQKWCVSDVIRPDTTYITVLIVSSSSKKQQRMKALRALMKQKS